MNSEIVIFYEIINSNIVFIKENKVKLVNMLSSNFTINFCENRLLYFVAMNYLLH